MNTQVRFALPEDGASDDERWRALEVMGAVRMTIDQLERGNALYRRVHHEAAKQAYAAKENPPAGERPNDLAMAELERFCVIEGLAPAEVAAHTIRLRYFPVEDARAGGVDLQAECPASFAALVSCPIDPGCMGFDDLDSIQSPSSGNGSTCG